MTSPDGITWTLRAAGGGWQSWRLVTYANGLFVAVGSGQVMTSTSGRTWTRRTVDGFGWWSAVAHGNGIFVAVGSGRVMTSSQTVENIAAPHGIRYFDNKLQVHRNNEWIDAAAPSGVDGDLQDHIDTGISGGVSDGAHGFRFSSGRLQVQENGAWIDAAVPMTGGTMTGQLVAQSNTANETAQVRNVIISTQDLVAGTSPLENGVLYFVYR